MKTRSREPAPGEVEAALALTLPVLSLEKSEVPMSMFIVAVSRASERIPNCRYEVKCEPLTFKFTVALLIP